MQCVYVAIKTFQKSQKEAGHRSDQRNSGITDGVPAVDDQGNGGFPAKYVGQGTGLHKKGARLTK
jgi:hypothetical protein